MTAFTQGSSRHELEPRTALATDERLLLEASGALIADEGRVRPLYFDGRFLAATDLTREQQHYLGRQADLGRALGSGVVHGLRVEHVQGKASSVRIRAGHGLCATGESVVLMNDIEVDLTDVGEMQRLDAAFGLSRLPRESARSRSGLFVLALRPVEFSARPVPQFPTSVDGQRSVQDGSIIEAVAVTLVPFVDDGGAGELDPRRARAVRRIFVERSSAIAADQALPIAMLGMNLGTLEWIDEFLARRDLGPQPTDVLGLDFTPRAQREAFVQQYDQHLLDVLDARARTNRGQKFAASEHFRVLPPVGRMPRAAIAEADFTQVFFPSEASVELAVVAADELVAIVEESSYLPPIDLELGSEQLESTAVTVLLPVERKKLRAALASVSETTRGLRAPAPGKLATRRPLEALQGFLLPRLALAPTPVGGGVDDAWRTLLAGQQLLWFARRRHAPSEIVVQASGAALAPVGGNPQSVTPSLAPTGSKPLAVTGARRVKAPALRKAAKVTRTATGTKPAKSTAKPAAAAATTKSAPRSTSTARKARRGGAHKRG